MIKNNKIAALMAERYNAVALAEDTLPAASAVIEETHIPVQAEKPCNKGGRPKATNPLDKRVSLSITQSLYKLVASAAQQDGRSINAYLLGIIEDTIKINNKTLFYIILHLFNVFLCLMMYKTSNTGGLQYVRLFLFATTKEQSRLEGLLRTALE